MENRNNISLKSNRDNWPTNANLYPMSNPPAINPAEIAFTQYMSNYLSPQSSSSSSSPSQAIRPQPTNFPSNIKSDPTFTSKLSDTDEPSNGKNRKNEQTKNDATLLLSNNSSKLSISNMLPELNSRFFIICHRLFNWERFLGHCLFFERHNIILYDIFRKK